MLGKPRWSRHACPNSGGKAPEGPDQGVRGGEGFLAAAVGEGEGRVLIATSAGDGEATLTAAAAGDGEGTTLTAAAAGEEEGEGGILTVAAAACCCLWSLAAAACSCCFLAAAAAAIPVASAQAMAAEDARGEKMQQEHGELASLCVFHSAGNACSAQCSGTALAGRGPWG